MLVFDVHRLVQRRVLHLPDLLQRLQLQRNNCIRTVWPAASDAAAAAATASATTAAIAVAAAAAAAADAAALSTTATAAATAACASTVPNGGCCAAKCLHLGVSGGQSKHPELRHRHLASVTTASPAATPATAACAAFSASRA